VEKAKPSACSGHMSDGTHYPACSNDDKSHDETTWTSITERHAQRLPTPPPPPLPKPAMEGVNDVLGVAWLTCLHQNVAALTAVLHGINCNVSEVCSTIAVAAAVAPGAAITQLVRPSDRGATYSSPAPCCSADVSSAAQHVTTMGGQRWVTQPSPRMGLVYQTLAALQLLVCKAQQDITPHTSNNVAVCFMTVIQRCELGGPTAEQA
jgi:hypothetical protein